MRYHNIVYKREVVDERDGVAMQLDAKDRRVLNFLLEEERWENIEILCKKLNFSRSNLNYHLEHINKVLKKHNLELINLKTKKISNCEELKKFYDEVIKRDANIFLNTEERTLVITMLLVFNKQLTLKNLASVLGVSINSIFNDIQALKQNSYIKQLNIKFEINKKGYSFFASSIDLHKLLINVLIEISELDKNNNILWFLVKNVNFDDYHFLKNQNVSNISFFRNIQKLVKEMYKKILYKSMNEDTLCLMLFIVFTKKFDFELLDADLSIYQEMKSKFKETTWYTTSSQLIDKIKQKYHLDDTPIGHFEKLYVAQMISSHYSEEIVIENFEQQTAYRSYNWLKDYFEERGYKINPTMNMLMFLRVYYYFQLIPFKNLYDGNWLDKRILSFKDWPTSKMYLQDFEKATLENPNGYIVVNKYQFWLVASAFLIGVISMPPLGGVLITKAVYLVTNLTNVKLNLWIYRVLRTYKNVESYEIISPSDLEMYRKTNPKRTMITNLKLFEGDNLIYVADE